MAAVSPAPSRHAPSCPPHPSSLYLSTLPRFALVGSSDGGARLARAHASYMWSSWPRLRFSDGRKLQQPPDAPAQGALPLIRGLATAEKSSSPKP